MKCNTLISRAVIAAMILSLAFLTSCDLENNLIVTLPTQTVTPAGFQLRPTAPNTVTTDTATIDTNQIRAAIPTEYKDYAISNITVNKITIRPVDGTTQLGDLCQYMKVKLNGDDIASTLDSYDSTDVSITLQPIPGGPDLSEILESLSSTPILFECQTSDEGVETTLGLSLDVDVIIELDPNE